MLGLSRKADFPGICTQDTINVLRDLKNRGEGRYGTEIPKVFENTEMKKQMSIEIQKYHLTKDLMKRYYLQKIRQKKN